MIFEGYDSNVLGQHASLAESKVSLNLFSNDDVIQGF